MSDDLVKRLRMDIEPSEGDMEAAADRIAELEAALQKKGCARDQNTTQFCAEAVALQARVAELEAALRPFSEMFLYPDDWGFETAEDVKSDPDWCSDANDLQHENLFVLLRDIRKARAALAGGKDE